MKTARDPRHQHRRLLIQELYAYSLNRQTDITHTDSLSIIKNLETIDNLISKNAPERPINSINKVDLSILRLGAYEILYRLDLTKNIIIDEAVELAKEFGSDNSPEFINAVLAKIARP